MHNHIQNFLFNPLYPSHNYGSAKSFGFDTLMHKLHLTSFFHKKQEGIKLATIDTMQRRHMVLPYRGTDRNSVLYYKNRIRLRYMDYFRQTLLIFERLLVKHSFRGNAFIHESDYQLTRKQLTFLLLRADEIRSALTKNHFLLADTLRENSPSTLECLAKDQSSINMDILNFLSDLSYAKKNLLKLMKAFIHHNQAK